MGTNAAIPAIVRPVGIQAMTDIVQRLRDASLEDGTPLDALMIEAADEIERLRAQARERIMLLDDQLGTPCEQIRHQQELAATIERCAQVAESFHAYDRPAADIAAAIRALKERP